MDGLPFVNAARAQTMLRDFNRLRRAIARHDPEATEKAWEKCERWVSCLPPNDGSPFYGGLPSATRSNGIYQSHPAHNTAEDTPHD